ncbi:GDSL esterase/lipase At5g03610-like [Cucurbita pepo subsp. pepo]|uniref:GDSL esterase/lipase At5g03610-like n=1 Tax=Cucurbita pepo subsp. pepo TaxID=3664 RepID=UPI000C9D4853|nr:GDSL esterase/lipase At5g03610-like [Cucurbita pepo subsp. pepo]
MESTKLFLPFFTLSLLSGLGLARHHHHQHRHLQTSKLFVFGDSYVDTGNTSPSDPNYPKTPYGVTFPGHPDGRFSNGRVLTDYVARIIGLKSPIPYRVVEKEGVEGAKDGVNFAYGGTGVFKTGYDLPTMTTQIDFLQYLIANSTFTPQDINSSFALVSVSGNDYSYYLSTNGSIKGFVPLIVRVVKQIGVNLKRIHSLGVKKISITALGPLQCVPEITSSSDFKHCNSSLALLVDFHNLLLRQAVDKLNKETNDSPFFILDLHAAFLSIIQNKGDPQGSIKFETPLKPCCYGASPGYYCGSVDEDGQKKYVLCEDPNSAFFWDEVHPTQQGWIAALTFLISTMKQHV